MADHKPLEEFYDLESDPHEVHNLIDRAAQRPEWQAALDRLRRQLYRWTMETRDTGLIPEAELEVRGRQLGSRFQVLRQPGSDTLLERLLDANRRACDTASDEAPLLRACQDRDAAVRYWALVGLANRRANSPAAQAAIGRALTDPSGSVQIAAARAAWRSGRTAEALPVIRQAATSGEEFLALMAMHLIDDMDEQAAPVWDLVPWVIANSTGYPARVAEHLWASQNTEENQP
jgi:uncharacterized sulfatase